MFPAIQNLISKWSPLNEKGKFMCVINGGTLGTVITWPLAAFLMQHYGWQSAYYAGSAIAILLTVLWYWIVYNSPADHPRIRQEERDLIKNSLGSEAAKPARRCPPLMCLLTSVPLWSLLLLHYGAMWAVYVLMIGAPKYMNEVLDFKLADAGLFASLPYLARFTSSFVFGALADSLLKNNCLSKTTIRKTFCIFCELSRCPRCSEYNLEHFVSLQRISFPDYCCCRSATSATIR